MKPIRLSLRQAVIGLAAVAACLVFLPAANAKAAAINCSKAAAMCTEVGNSWQVFGH